MTDRLLSGLGFTPIDCPLPTTDTDPPPPPEWTPGTETEAEPGIAR